MVTVHITADVDESRKVVVQLPPQTPVGRIDLLVVADAADVGTAKRPRRSLADWAEQNAENWGSSTASGNVEQFTGRG